MNAAACPLCGNSLKDHSFAVDLQGNCVNISGVTFKMTPQETEFLHFLEKQNGKTASTRDIVYALWGGGPIPIGADQIIARYAADIRRFAEPFGVLVESVFSGRNRSYRLTRKEVVSV